jgi:nucleoside-diphosphate-sugar epimerase
MLAAAGQPDLLSSSACIYPAHDQEDPNHPNCAEDSAYPAAPHSEYGWEKLFSERLYSAYARNHAMEVRVARYHNVFGPEGTWDGGREKAPAALCRKVAMQPAGGAIEIWGPGTQTALVSLHPRVHRRHDATDALQLLPAGQHRLGGARRRPRHQLPDRAVRRRGAQAHRQERRRCRLRARRSRYFQRLLFQQQYRIFGSFGASMRNIGESLTKMASGLLPVIDTEVALADFERGLARLESRQVFGKIIVMF